MGNKISRPTLFKHIICNMILVKHPFVTAKFTRPLIAKIIYKYYLNTRTVYLEYKASIYYRNIFVDDSNLFHILHTSISHNCFHAVKTLIEFGLNRHINYAVQLASLYGHLNIVKLLFEK